MTAPIKRYYAVTDLAYDDIEVVVLAGEQEIIARRERSGAHASRRGAASVENDL
jgi:hypothetical protein